MRADSPRFGEGGRSIAVIDVAGRPQARNLLATARFRAVLVRGLGRQATGDTPAILDDLIATARSVPLPFLASVAGPCVAMLVDRIGFGRASQMSLLGETIDATTAHSWGVVTAVVPESELDEAAIALAERLAAGPTIALSSIKVGHGALAHSGSPCDDTSLGSAERARGVTRA